MKQNKPLKVLFLSAWYPHRNDPMSGLFVRKHAEAVALYATTAVLYVVTDKNVNKTEIVSKNINGITEFIVYFPVPQSSFLYRFFMLLNFLRAYISGFRILHKSWGKPDIVQANVFTRTVIIAFIYKIFFKVPYVVIEHWTRYFRPITFNNIFHKKTTQLAAKYASAILPVTAHLKKNMERHGLLCDNYIVIDNVVDDIFIKNKSVNNRTKISIINVTCFDDEQKNLSGILRVIKKLYTERQDFKLTMIGTGKDFEKIHSMAHEMNLLNNVVFFTGMLEGEALVNEFFNSDFNLLFSNYENIPVVISESLICGKPVVSTNVGGINEHINSTNGILIERNDEGALLIALNKMLDSIKQYDSVAIKESALKKYSYVSVGQKLFSIYESILTK